MTDKHTLISWLVVVVQLHIAFLKNYVILSFSKPKMSQLPILSISGWLSTGQYINFWQLLS